jgi:SAM-dependent methyltransferase
VELVQAVIDRRLPVFLVRHELHWIGTEINLNLGAGRKTIGESVRLDLPDWDARTMDIPYSDSSVHNIYAFHFLEHLEPEAVIRVLRECLRVLVPGGVLNIGVPYFRSQGAFHDLGHRSFFTEDTWKNTFFNQYNDEEHHQFWKWGIGLNLIVGQSERNLMLVTQLRKAAADYA